MMASESVDLSYRSLYSPIVSKSPKGSAIPVEIWRVKTLPSPWQLVLGLYLRVCAKVKQRLTSRKGR
jgi:hypothetical protein